MPRAKTKHDLLIDTKREYETLIQYIHSLDDETKHAAFILEDRDKNIKDVLCHLYHWHLMFEAWYQRGLDGSVFKTPTDTYSWRDLPLLNLEIHALYQDITLARSLELLNNAYLKNLSLLESLDETVIFEKGYYPWTKSSALSAYFIGNGPSHYLWAYKKIKKQIRAIKNA